MAALTRTSPRGSVARVACMHASSTSSKARSTRWKSSCPSGVSSRPLAPRMRRRTPRWASSRATFLLKADGVVPASRAAALKLPERTLWTKDWSEGHRSKALPPRHNPCALEGPTMLPGHRPWCARAFNQRGHDHEARVRDRGNGLHRRLRGGGAAPQGVLGGGGGAPSGGCRAHLRPGHRNGGGRAGGQRPAGAAGPRGGCHRQRRRLGSPGRGRGARGGAEGDEQDARAHERLLHRGGRGDGGGLGARLRGHHALHPGAPEGGPCRHRPARARLGARGRPQHRGLPHHDLWQWTGRQAGLRPGAPPHPRVLAPPGRGAHRPWAQRLVERPHRGPDRAVPARHREGPARQLLLRGARRGGAQGHRLGHQPHDGVGGKDVPLGARRCHPGHRRGDGPLWAGLQQPGARHRGQEAGLDPPAHLAAEGHRVRQLPRGVRAGLALNTARGRPGFSWPLEGWAPGPPGGGPCPPGLPPAPGRAAAARRRCARGRSRGSRRRPRARGSDSRRARPPPAAGACPRAAPVPASRRAGFRSP
ncbi:hypothetical protein STIAU_5985 [Stigmatella aurantiaca DW4/3-1]|uniref:Uncharacterized protein n=1 Tax=Stigmatella aurantiaca (strain DW4/3-1) TaxID=378806 RepID=Q08WY4_STIAD|nr:hypothetical protein STIAU_5985 [Stigmatella aurantiaca DW4/3-1]